MRSTLPLSAVGRRAPGAGLPLSIANERALARAKRVLAPHWAAVLIEDHEAGTAVFFEPRDGQSRALVQRTPAGATVTIFPRGDVSRAEVDTFNDGRAIRAALRLHAEKPTHGVGVELPRYVRRVIADFATAILPGMIQSTASASGDQG